MSLFRNPGSNEIFIPIAVDQAFDVCLRAAEQVGNVTQASKVLNCISIKIPMKLFPPRNPTTLMISLVPQDNGCFVRCSGDSMDGLAGFGSVAQAIDSFYSKLSLYLG